MRCVKTIDEDLIKEEKEMDLWSINESYICGVCGRKMKNGKEDFEISGHTEYQEIVYCPHCQ